MWRQPWLKFEIYYNRNKEEEEEDGSGKLYFSKRSEFVESTDVNMVPGSHKIKQYYLVRNIANAQRTRRYLSIVRKVLNESNESICTAARVTLEEFAASTIVTVVCYTVSSPSETLRALALTI